jgi:cation:H+ antiporter
MNLTVALLQVFGGFVLLAGGGELLVRGAIAVSRQLRIPPVVIGLTVVALATSLPELAVSLLAALRGSPDLAVGNVVGSNMFNIAAIVGISAMLFPPLHFRPMKLRLDVLVMLLAVFLAIFFSRDLFVARWEGIFFLALLVLFLTIRVKGVRDGGQQTDHAEDAIPNAPEPAGSGRKRIVGSIVLIVLGAGLLTGGAELLVRGAVTIAAMAGVSERVIAITLVSAGTGLPELATAIVAGIRKHASVAVGNVIGSNIFNIFGILGTVAMVSPVPVSRRIFAADMWWMLAFSLLALLPIFNRHRRPSRIEGAVIFAAYVVYVISLF